MYKMPKLVFIEARTGCSCCSDENHYRGPYRTKKDAEQRVKYYKAENSEFWPIGSQFARRGSYFIDVWDAEEISENRWIIGDKVVYRTPFVNVLEDGSLATDEENRDEEFCKSFYSS
jgi:hypothetical protein